MGSGEFEIMQDRVKSGHHTIRGGQRQTAMGKLDSRNVQRLGGSWASRIAKRLVLVGVFPGLRLSCDFR